jgi:hypothetical protein
MSFAQRKSILCVYFHGVDRCLIRYRRCDNVLGQTLRKIANLSSPRLGEPVKEVGKVKVSHISESGWYAKVEENMRVSLAERSTSPHLAPRQKKYRQAK